MTCQQETAQHTHNQYPLHPDTLCAQCGPPSGPWFVESAVLYVVIPRSRLFLHDAILLLIHPVVDVEHPSVTEIIAVNLDDMLVMNASTVISVCFVSFAKSLATSTAKQWTPGLELVDPLLSVRDDHLLSSWKSIFRTTSDCRRQHADATEQYGYDCFSRFF